MNVLEKILEEIEDRKSYHEELLSQRDDYEIQKMYCDEELNWIRDTIRSNMVEKEEVSSAEIISRDINGKPYYEIKYRKVGEDHYTVGYSSYKLDYVIEWLNKYFEFCGKAKVVVNDGWIPVEERLPDIDTDVIITDRDGNVYTDVTYGFAEEKDKEPSFLKWDDECWNCYKYDAIAWMELPEPYRTE